MKDELIPKFFMELSCITSMCREVSKHTIHPQLEETNIFFCGVPEIALGELQNVRPKGVRMDDHAIFVSNLDDRGFP